MKRIYLLIISFLLMKVVAEAQHLGIGTSTPQFKMNVNGRICIMCGADINNTAELWLNNIANKATPAFNVMQKNEQLGIYGNTSSWSFVMNISTGNTDNF